MLFILILILYKLDNSIIRKDSSSRTTIWLHTIKFIKEKLLFGYGLNSFSKLPDNYLNKFTDPHNSTLEILLFNGLFGLSSALCYNRYSNL